MEFHEAANLFPMEMETIDALAEDIKVNGQKETIKLYFDKIIDGRRRFTACQKADINPSFEAVTTDDPVAYVVSLNMHRRHLTPSQKSMVAARIRDIYDQQAKERQGKRNDLNGANIPEKLPESKRDSRDAAGKAVGVNGKYVDHATKVLEHGEPELVKAVDEGRIAVSTAAISAMGDDPETQKELATNAKRTYQRKPKTQPEKQELNAEEREAVKRGEIFDAKRFALMATKQVDRIRRSDPTAIESLRYVLKYVEMKLQEWS